MSEVIRYDLTEDCETGKIDITPVPGNMDGRYVSYDYYAVLAVQLANAESKCMELVAENSGLKNALEWLYETVSSESVSVPDEKYSSVTNAAQVLSETQVTDSFLAEVRAQGVEALVLRRKTAARIARERDDLRAADALEGEAYRAQMFADEIRQEAK